eukprot:jgi/Ulvmu1/10876/UM007_0052.1
MRLCCSSARCRRDTRPAFAAPSRGYRHQALHLPRAISTVEGDVEARVHSVANDFKDTSGLKEKLTRLINIGTELPRMDAADKKLANQVMGCAARVWMIVTKNKDGSVHIQADSDSDVSRGLASLLVQVFEGCSIADISSVDIRALDELQVGPALASPSRTNSFHNMFSTLKKRADALDGNLPKFPSLIITKDALTPQGAFAEAQAQYLQPDMTTVDRLATALQEKKIGIVAHFYMDPEVQGVLSSAREKWPHIHISDSLVMADRAVAMAEAGCKAVCVLGVDFMSENVRAILDNAGHTDVAVYRMSADSIGCTLAEAAESPAYLRWLDGAADTGNGVHVIYINTSLRTKAEANARVPTITCTSSNVVKTVLQAFAQVPDVHVWYGPDTYMGRNLQELFTSLAGMPDEAVAALHPAHTAETVRAALPRLHAFPEGTCVVHHIFGGETAAAVRQGYGDAFITAHFEVPGEMFSIAMQAQRERGMGVVGSTSNILDFISEKVQEAQGRGFADRLQFVLGTESGMITSIVRKVQAMLAAQESGPDLEVEIVFPVASEAITAGDSVAGSRKLPGGLAVVPGPAGGEGCSAEGGCAACPYMKMNSLSALERVCGMVGDAAGEAVLVAYAPETYKEEVNGMTVVEGGCKPILHMRDFQRTGILPDGLVSDISA